MSKKFICSLTCFEKKKTCINLISNGSFNDKSNSFKKKKYASIQSNMSEKGGSQY